MAFLQDKRNRKTAPSIRPHGSETHSRRRTTGRFYWVQKRVDGVELARYLKRAENAAPPLTLPPTSTLANSVIADADVRRQRWRRSLRDRRFGRTTSTPTFSVIV